MADRIVQEIEVVAKVDDAIRKIDRLESDFKAAMRDIKSETKKATKTTKELGDAADKVGKKIKEAFQIAAVVAFTKRASDLSGEFFKSTQRLTLALEDLDAAAQLQSMQDFAADIQNVAAVSDEQVRSLLTLGATAGFSGGELQKLVTATLGLSAATGRDAITTMNNLQKTLVGLKEESVRTIPEIANLTAEELKAGEAIDRVAEKYAKFIPTLAGEEGSLERGMNKLSIAFDDFTESIGKSLGTLGVGSVGEFFGEIIVGLGFGAEQVARRIAFVGNLGKAVLGQATGDFHMVNEAGRRMKEITEEGAQALAEFRRQATKGVPKLLERPGVEPGVKPDLLAEQRAREREQRKKEAEIQAQIDEAIFKARIEAEQNRQKAVAAAQEKEHQDRIARISSRIDEELNLRHSALDRRMALELSLARFQDQQLQEEEQRLAKQQQVYTDFYNKLGGVALDFTNASIDALFAQRDGEKHAFKEMLKNFLNFTGSKMIANGLQDSYEGASMIVTGDPRGAAKLGLGVAQVAIGTGMKAGSLAVKVPETGAASTAGVGGSQAATSRGGDTGPARAASINIFGAMTTEESAILIERGMRQAHARGFA